LILKNQQDFLNSERASGINYRIEKFPDEPCVFLGISLRKNRDDPFFFSRIAFWVESKLDSCGNYL